VRPDLQRSLSGLREALEREMERVREERDTLRRIMRENEELRKRIQEYEEQLRTLKIVKEVPIELRVAHEGAAPAQAATDTVPEVVYRCRYPGAVKVYQYLASAGDFVKLKDVANATGLSVANVKRIVRYFKKRGLVRAKTVSMCGREVIRMVRLR
jgi:DNA-binding transcriptional regulator GbsR (MarR family)